MLNVAGIVNDSIVDGDGYRATIFEQGCSHNCAFCQNPDTHSFDVKKEYSVEQLIDIISSNKLLDGVTLSGGDPFFQAKENIALINEIHKLGLNVWAYTGFVWEQFYDFKYKAIQHKGLCIVTGDMIDMLEICDVIVDGKFNNINKTLNINYIGSSNQRIIDVKKSLGHDIPYTIKF